MWRYSALLGGGGTPTPTPTASTRTFIDGSSTKFGLAPGSGTTGAANTMGSKFGLGTTTAAIQGLILETNIGFNRSGAFSLYVNTVLVADWMPSNFSAHGIISIPIAIPSGALVEVTAATNTSTAVSVVPHPYQSDVVPLSVSGAALGAHTNVFNQGVNLAALAPDTWQLIGSLASDADSLSFGIGLGNKTSGRGSKTSYTDIGISASGSSSPDSILMADLLSVCTATTVQPNEVGPFRFSGLTSGKKIWARAADTDGALADPLSVQAVAWYKS